MFAHLAEAGGRPHRHWRESVFFVAHPVGGGDVLAATVIARPRRGSVEAYVMARVDGELSFTRWARAPGDPACEPLAVGGVTVDLADSGRILVRADDPAAPVGFDLEWTARTEPYRLPHGTVTDDRGPVWDQDHLFQSGWFNGSYRVGDEVRGVENWWGQRDHSWGIRDHRRTSMWLWLAIQLPDGMLGAWCWERADGTRAYTEGCWAPTDGAPVPLTHLAHDLHWEGDHGLGGSVEFGLSTGYTIAITGAGEFASRYGRLGGGQQLMSVRTSDGRVGTGIYELTGSLHNRYFPGSPE